ncbi:MAG: hypothetical protein AB7I38_07740 [Dehalococcoidia bacterium]
MTHLADRAAPADAASRDRPDFGRALTRFTAAAGMIAPVVILLAALVAVGAYLAFDQQAVGSGRALLLAAAAIALAWLGSSILLATRGNPETATPRAYLNLLNHCAETEDALARVEVHRTSEADRALIARIRDQLRSVRAVLGVEDPGAPENAVALSGRVDWLRSAGYNECYKRVHAIQADLLLLYDRAELLAAIHEDYLALTDSHVPGADTLQYNLERSVADLGLDPATFFARPKGTIAATPAAAPSAAAPADPTPSEENRFRVRSVRMALDAFRDRTFEGLIHQRDRARASTAATGAILYVVLVWTLLFDIKHDTLLYAAILFAVGAAVGVFARLLIQSEVGSDVEDYGLYMARVAQTVVASGVAALLGVVVTVYGIAAINNSDLVPVGAAASNQPAATASPVAAAPIPTAVPTATTPAPEALDGSANDVRLESVFDFETYPIAIVLAAIFGLSPTLLLKRLEDATTRLKLDIKSTESNQTPSK